MTALALPTEGARAATSDEPQRPISLDELIEVLLQIPRAAESEVCSLTRADCSAILAALESNRGLPRLAVSEARNVLFWKSGARSVKPPPVPSLWTRWVPMPEFYIAEAARLRMQAVGETLALAADVSDECCALLALSVLPGSPAASSSITSSLFRAYADGTSPLDASELWASVLPCTALCDAAVLLSDRTAHLEICSEPLRRLCDAARSDRGAQPSEFAMSVIRALYVAGLAIVPHIRAVLHAQWSPLLHTRIAWVCESLPLSDAVAELLCTTGDLVHSIASKQ